MTARRNLAAAVFLVAALLSFAPAGTRAESAPTRLYYRIEIRVESESTYRDGKHDHLTRTTSWSAKSDHATILFRKNEAGDFGFLAGAEGFVEMHEGSGMERWRPQGVPYRNWYCDLKRTEIMTSEADPTISIAIASESVRRRGIGVGVVEPEGLLAVSEVKTSCKNEDRFSPPSDLINSPYCPGCLVMGTEKAELGLDMGRDLRFGRATFGRDEITLARTVRWPASGPTRFVFKYRFVFKRCPDQDLAQGCRT